jgi:hypothetical protein
MMSTWMRIAALFLPLAAGAQSVAPPDRATFVVLLGQDTVAAERVMRHADSAEGDLRMKIPLLHITQRLTLGAAGTVQRVGFAVGRGISGDSAVQHSELILRGDSAVAHVDPANGAPVSERRIAVPAGAVPFVNLSGLSMEQLLRRARALGGDSVNVPVLFTGGQVVLGSVVRLGADSVVVHLAGTELRARTDSDGRLLGAAVPSQAVRFVRASGDSPAASWSPTAVSCAAPAGAPQRRRGRRAHTGGAPPRRDAHRAGAPPARGFPPSC